MIKTNKLHVLQWIFFKIIHKLDLSEIKMPRPGTSLLNGTIDPDTGVSVKRAVGAGLSFFKECYFRVRFRVRISNADANADTRHVAGCTRPIPPPSLR